MRASGSHQDGVVVAAGRHLQLLVAVAGEVGFIARPVSRPGGDHLVDVVVLRRQHRPVAAYGRGQLWSSAGDHREAVVVEDGQSSGTS
jgi:hypothetical protein